MSESNRIYFNAPKLNIPEIVERQAFYFEDEPEVWYIECVIRCSNSR